MIESVARTSTRAEHPGMDLIRIDHVSLNVGDRPASLAWYEEVLGLRARSWRDTPADAPVFLGATGAQLGLFADRAPGLRHVALATTRADQEHLAGRLSRLGIAHRPERHRAHDSIYFADPDGTTLEVLVPTG
jgi:catechol 2,3-dioxygenase-like lactoylglutathione lyase family enzyme